MSTFNLCNTLNDIDRRKREMGLGVNRRMIDALKEILCMLDVKRRYGHNNQIGKNADHRINIAKRQIKMMKRLRGGL